MFILNNYQTISYPSEETEQSSYTHYTGWVFSVARFSPLFVGTKHKIGYEFMCIFNKGFEHFSVAGS
jgi:hypothetical protein